MPCWASTTLSLAVLHMGRTHNSYLLIVRDNNSLNLILAEWGIVLGTDVVIWMMGWTYVEAGARGLGQDKEFSDSEGPQPGVKKS